MKFLILNLFLISCNHNERKFVDEMIWEIKKYKYVNCHKFNKRNNLLTCYETTDKKIRFMNCPIKNLILKADIYNYIRLKNLHNFLIKLDNSDEGLIFYFKKDKLIINNKYEFEKNELDIEFVCRVL
ncbi:MAG: hypothetical protein GDA46_04555 [Bdellovibrionales bacterium]|nr:hypothetical protein [Bdellovibrionales bacterium]